MQNIQLSVIARRVFFPAVAIFGSSQEIATREAKRIASPWMTPPEEHRWLAMTNSDPL